MECSETIEKNACMEAKIRVTPMVETGKVEYACIGEPKREACEGTLCPEYDFMISQMVCLRIPITLSAGAQVVEAGFVCGKQSRDCEPRPCDEMREHEVIIFGKDCQESKPVRSFAMNYLLTYQNNPEPT